MRFPEPLFSLFPKRAAAAIFQLKQPFNGGYVESTQQVDQGATVTLKIEGVGGVDAFK